MSLLGSVLRLPRGGQSAGPVFSYCREGISLLGSVLRLPRKGQSAGPCCREGSVCWAFVPLVFPAFLGCLL